MSKESKNLRPNMAQELLWKLLAIIGQEALFVHVD